MQTEIEAARALTWRAARPKDAGRPHTVEGAQAKLFASRRRAPRQTGEAIQVLGGYGYTKEFPAERYYRDAKVTEIYEGTARSSGSSSPARCSATSPAPPRPERRPPPRLGGRPYPRTRAAHARTPGRHRAGNPRRGRLSAMHPSLIGIAHAQAINRSRRRRQR